MQNILFVVAIWHWLMFNSNAAATLRIEIEEEILLAQIFALFALVVKF